MTVEKCPSWHDAAGGCNWGRFSDPQPWSGAQRTATGIGGQDIAADSARRVIKNSNRRASADESKRRVVRIKGVPKAMCDPAVGRQNVAKPAGDVRLLRGFQDTQTHELNAVINGI